VSSSERLIEDLAAAVGPQHVLTEPDMVAGYVRDWTGRWTGHTRAVVRPGTVEEVARVVRICGDSGTPLVPQGGNTGLVGGSVPHRGEVVLSLRRLDGIGQPSAGSVVAGAGVTLGALQARARQVGFDYGVDLASRDSATVGGTIATNAGGPYVVSRGSTRRQVLGLEVVLADGSVVSTIDALPKTSTGPDVLQTMIGSEGTFGVITAARLRLSPHGTEEPMVLLMGLERLGDGLTFLAPGIRALEFFDSACLDAVVEHRGLARPLPGESPFYLLVETTSEPVVPDSLPCVVEPRLWAYRESITETINQLGVPVKLDVAVPPNKVDEFAETLHNLGLAGSWFLFGHLAEGNFHVNVVDSPDAEVVIDRVLEVVVGMGGAIASEHGIGVAKSEWWRRATDPALLRLARAMKQLLDPTGILNPALFWGD
jgi:FAD/FMN-containing dehydrogenase